MLAGPPRLVSLVSVLILFILAWSFLRLDLPPYSSFRFGKTLGMAFSSASLRADPLDFGIPLRFRDGQPKPAGTNYTWSIVIPKTQKEDLKWLQGQIPEAKLVVYEVDNPNAEYKVPKNKGREAMVRERRQIPGPGTCIHQLATAWLMQSTSGLSHVHD